MDLIVSGFKNCASNILLTLDNLIKYLNLLKFKMSILAKLPEKYQHKLNCSDINIVKEFLNLDIDPRLFDISTCTNGDCFTLLIEKGYPVTIRDVSDIFMANEDITTEIKCTIIKCLMDNPELVEKLDLNHEIFTFAVYNAVESETRILLKFIVENFPNVALKAKFFYGETKFASIIYPFADFTSKELVNEYLGNPELLYDDEVYDLFEYCDPDDYVNHVVFKKMSNYGFINQMKYLVSMGYRPSSEDFPSEFRPWSTKSFDYFKSLGIWDGETFDWDSYASSLKRKPSLDDEEIQWLNENGCPNSLSVLWKKPVVKRASKSYLDSDSDSDTDFFD
jgi:hypothetical protein